MGSRYFFALIYVSKALNIEILFIFFVVDNEIMMNINKRVITLQKLYWVTLTYKKIMLNKKNVHVSSKNESN